MNTTNTIERKLPNDIETRIILKDMKEWEKKNFDWDGAESLVRDISVSKDTMPRSVASVEIFWECDCGKMITGEWSRKFDISDMYVPALPSSMSMKEEDEYTLISEDGFTSSHDSMNGLVEIMLEDRREHKCHPAWSMFAGARDSLLKADNALARMQKQIIDAQYEVRTALNEIGTIIAEEMQKDS